VHGINAGMTNGPVIPRLHHQDGSTSCYMLAGRASLMFARCLLDRVNGV